MLTIINLFENVVLSGVLGTVFLEGPVGCQPICAPIMLRLINEGRRHARSAAGARIV
jgi:hypothetical protein